MSQINRADRIAKSGQIDLALDILHDYLEEKMLAGEHKELSEDLNKIDIKALHPRIVSNIITGTYEDRIKIKARAQFLAKARKYCGIGSFLGLD